MIAAQAALAAGFVCFTTHRDFDGDVRTPWREAGEKLERLLVREHGAAPGALVFAGQIHGDRIHVVGPDATGVQRVEDCDGLATARRDVFLVIRTADCLPVVLVDEAAGVCAGLHAGWRGSFDGIVTRGVETMIALGADAGRIRGWIGPAITPERYEVSPELADDFRKRHGSLGQFSAGRHLDLPRLNMLQASGAGLLPGALEFCGMCTMQRDDLFHSHRRQGTVRGHQFTVCGFLR